jgi:Putative DNA-binding domain
MEDDPQRRLREVLRQGYEDRDLDYKAPMAWNEKDRKACCEIVKDILALANTHGGVLVIGVEEPLAGGAYRYTGLTEEQLRSWETTRVNQFVQTYADPPINTTLHRLEDNGKWYVVIGVPVFSHVPHFCRQDFPPALQRFTLYVRTANNASAPISSAADFNMVIEQAVRTRSDQLLESMRSILVGASVGPTVSNEQRFQEQLFEVEQHAPELSADWPAFHAFRDAAWWPARYDPERFSLDELQEAVAQAHVLYRGWPFLYFRPGMDELSVLPDGLEATVRFTGYAPRYTFDHWQVRQSGLFYQRVLAAEDGVTAKPAGRWIWFDELTIYVAEAIDCLSRLYEALGITDEAVTFRVRMVDTQGRTVERSSPSLGGTLATYTCPLPELSRTKTYSVEEWRAGRVDHAAEITRELLQRCNWLDPPLQGFRAMIERHFQSRTG